MQYPRRPAHDLPATARCVGADSSRMSNPSTPIFSAYRLLKRHSSILNNDCSWKLHGKLLKTPVRSWTPYPGLQLEYSRECRALIMDASNSHMAIASALTL